MQASGSPVLEVIPIKCPVASNLADCVAATEPDRLAPCKLLVSLVEQSVHLTNCVVMQRLQEVPAEVVICRQNAIVHIQKSLFELNTSIFKHMEG